MTEASIGKDVARARVMLTNLLGVVTLRPKKDGLGSRAARKCAHPTGGNRLFCSNWCREGDFCVFNNSEPYGCRGCRLTREDALQSFQGSLSRYWVALVSNQIRTAGTNHPKREYAVSGGAVALSATAPVVSPPEVAKPKEGIV